MDGENVDVAFTKVIEGIFGFRILCRNFQPES